MILVAAVVACGFLFFKYKLNQNFADIRDMENAGLLNGKLMLLGVFKGRPVQFGEVLSVLAAGARGSGKTTTVAIPSILESDDFSIVAAGSESLPQYTSGYRGKIGKVFYFDWSAVDDEAKEKSFARWNPLSLSNLPPRGTERDKYLRSLIEALFDGREDEYWSKLSKLAMEGLLLAMTTKIEQACANDYFLTKLLNKEKLSKEEKEILLSYYNTMHKKFAGDAVATLKKNKLNFENYVPIGSWERVPKAWQGKELSLAFCADSLIQHYFLTANVDEDQDADGWKTMLDGFIREARFFGYGDRAVQMLEYIFYLSRRQRSIVFGMILKSLSIFKYREARERTSISDLKNSDFNGPAPITVYSVVKDEASAFMTRLLFAAISCTGKKVLFIADGLEEMGKISGLSEKILEKENAYLLLTQDIRKLENLYGTEGWKEILESLSVKMAKGKEAKGIAEILTGMKCRKAAKAVLKSESLWKPEQQVLAVKSLKPAVLEKVFFPNVESLANKAEIAPQFLVEESILKQRNPQDLNVPGLRDVLLEAGIKINSPEDLDGYFREQYSMVEKDLKQVVDKKAVLTEDISDRWKKKRKQAYYEGDEWWLNEASFERSKKEDANPFK